MRRGGPRGARAAAAVRICDDGEPVVEVLAERARSATSASRSRLVAATTRTSTFSGLGAAHPLELRLLQDAEELRLHGRAASRPSRRGTGCRRRPARTAPRRWRCAPVKAPFSWPNSSDSISCSRDGRAVERRRTGPAARGEARWRARATSSLPVPVSPVTRTRRLRAGHLGGEGEGLLPRLRTADGAVAGAFRFERFELGGERLHPCFEARGALLLVGETLVRHGESDVVGDAERRVGILAAVGIRLQGEEDQRANRLPLQADRDPHHRLHPLLELAVDALGRERELHRARRLRGTGHERPADRVPFDQTDVGQDEEVGIERAAHLFREPEARRVVGQPVRSGIDLGIGAVLGEHSQLQQIVGNDLPGDRRKLAEDRPHVERPGERGEQSLQSRPSPPPLPLRHRQPFTVRGEGRQAGTGRGGRRARGKLLLENGQCLRQSLRRQGTAAFGRAEHGRIVEERQGLRRLHPAPQHLRHAPRLRHAASRRAGLLGVEDFADLAETGVAEVWRGSRAAARGRLACRPDGRAARRR